MTAFVLDEKELLKLRKDILQNPEKYEALIKDTVDPHEDPYYARRDPGGVTEKWKLRAKNREYEHRFYNDGRADSVIMETDRVMYHNYVNYMKQTQDRAFSTLKLCVQRLIDDFKTNDVLDNRVETMTKHAKETKHESLRRLM